MLEIFRLTKFVLSSGFHRMFGHFSEFHEKNSNEVSSGDLIGHVICPLLQPIHRENFRLTTTKNAPLTEPVAHSAESTCVCLHQLPIMTSTVKEVLMSSASRMNRLQYQRVGVVQLGAFHGRWTTRLFLR